MDDRPNANQEAGKKILLVEDYGPNALTVTTLLGSLGYACDVAVNGREALKKTEHNYYDLILMDLKMPVMDGLETTRRIRTLEHQRGTLPTPIIAMTAHAEAHNRMQCAEAGMNGFLSKDFNLSALQSILEDFIPPQPLFPNRP